MFRRVNTIHSDEDAGKLLGTFGRGEVGVVINDGGSVLGIVTKMDLVDALTSSAGS